VSTLEETDQNCGRSTFYYYSRSRSPAVHSEAVYLGGLLVSALEEQRNEKSREGV
jgi:hypothetical protein